MKLVIHARKHTRAHVRAYTQARAHTHTHTHTHTETERQTDRQTEAEGGGGEREVGGRQTDRERERTQNFYYTRIKILGSCLFLQSVPANLHSTHKTIVTTLTTGVMMKKMRERETDRQTDRDRERQTDRQKQRDRDRETETERQTDRQRQTD